LLLFAWLGSLAVRVPTLLLILAGPTQAHLPFTLHPGDLLGSTFVLGFVEAFVVPF
jgi:hypothetical protein